MRHRSPLAPFLVTPLLALAAVSAQETARPTAPFEVATVNGMEMRYRTVGSGEPLVLLHSGAQSGEMWGPFVDPLAARYRLIIPDLRGHGGSTNPEGPLATRRFAADVYALLDQLGVDRFRAIGASAGGMTLLHMATQRPERIVAMVVVGVGTDLPAECRATLAGVSTDDLSETAWQRLRARHHHGDDQIRALYAWIASLAQDEGDMRFEPARLGAITAPTLIVHGDRDYCFPVRMALEIYQAVPTSFLWVVPNGTHVPLSGSNIDTFVATALEFLAGGWPPR